VLSESTLNLSCCNFSKKSFCKSAVKWAAVNLDNILFLPEVQKEFDDLHQAKQLGLIIVDHNRLAVSQEKYEESICEIVDHHKDEKRCPNAKSENRVIEMVGSCATLVAEKMLRDGALVNKAIARLLLAPIILDTVNLDPKFEKVTKKDEAVAVDLIKAAHFTADLQKDFFEKLQHERFSVDSLSTYDLLRCDYKQWTMGKWEVGVASAKTPLKIWLEKDPDLPKEFEKYLRLRKLHILYAMTQYMEGNDMKRELIVFTPNRELLEESKKFLLSSDLKLTEVEQGKAASMSTKDFSIALFSQANVAASRKQLQPLLVDNYEKK